MTRTSTLGPCDFLMLVLRSYATICGGASPVVNGEPYLESRQCCYNGADHHVHHHGIAVLKVQKPR
jgi:hypothetical protein